MNLDDTDTACTGSVRIFHLHRTTREMLQSRRVFTKQVRDHRISLADSITLLAMSLGLLPPHATCRDL
jgi:hypothetical protein